MDAREMLEPERKPIFGHFYTTAAFFTIATMWFIANIRRYYESRV